MKIAKEELKVEKEEVFKFQENGVKRKARTIGQDCQFGKENKELEEQIESKRKLLN